MSDAFADRALDALLAEYRPPTMSPGLADRVVAAALALPQTLSPPPPAPQPRRGGRGRWLRRPLLAGGAALGIAFTGAVAASLAGVELPRPVAVVVEKLPFIGKAAPAPSTPPPRPAARLSPPPAPAKADAPLPAVPDAAPPTPLPPRIERRIERLQQAREIVAARRAAGLPTPRADRIEARRERAREVVAARRAAGLPTPRADRMEARGERMRDYLERRRQGETAVPPSASSATPEAPAAASAPEPLGAAPATQAERRPDLDERRERLRQRLTGPERAEWLRRVQERRAALRRARPPIRREGSRPPPR